MRCNDEGIRIIKATEGWRSHPYLCSASVATIGYGSTRINNIPVTLDMEPITRERGEELLRIDLAKTERAIKRLIKVDLSSNEFSALCSFVYNVGSGNLQSSRDGAADEFPKWRRAGGRILAGLIRRRELERSLFLS